MKLEIGKKYIDGNNNVFEIDVYDEDDNTYCSSNEYWFTADGKLVGDYTDSKRHLIEEVVEMKPALKLEIGKSYRDRSGDVIKIRR